MQFDIKYAYLNFLQSIEHPLSAGDSSRKKAEQDIKSNYDEFYNSVDV